MIRCRALCVQNRNRTILSDIHLELNVPGVYLLLGPNGAGKTTFLKALLGLIPYQGDLFWAESNLADLKPRQRARFLGYVPQTLQTDFPLNARDLVESGRFPFVESKSRSYQAADQLMRQMGLLDLAESPISKLSGGELQRVVLASALAQEPKFLLLDEPANHLDPYHRQVLVKTLEHLANQGMGLLIISHDWEMFSSLQPHCFCLRGGRLTLSGSLGELAAQLPNLYLPDRRQE